MFLCCSGVDISQWCGEGTWACLKNAGYSFGQQPDAQPRSAARKLSHQRVSKISSLFLRALSLTPLSACLAALVVVCIGVVRAGCSNGAVDGNGVHSVANAWAAGIEHVDIYM